MCTFLMMHSKIAMNITEMSIWINEGSDYRGVQISEGPLYQSFRVGVIVLLLSSDGYIW